ncbi:MAG: TIGR00341 family protein [Bacteroidales bacterium]|nr:TIGR00341 family protein [Clostridium sp.]MCM1202519.1 TIGR00341 family protein [Bacteroidales bacterium]
MNKKEAFNEKAEAVKVQIEEKTIKNVRKSTYSFKRLFHAAFNLSADQADYEEIVERIESGVVLRGTNMCILILAIFIASVGLNMNSTAVIIGAMLVSPLMGAIMGIGFSIAIYDMNLLKRSATILLFEIVVALATSTIYFVISPIKTASAELLARTSPTAWDVIIAVCGGLAGMIGTTRKEKSNIIPGVAIATALMPPLCTSGYGLAAGNLRYFAGAMYLFCINGVFIAISTMLITVFLRIPSKNTTNDETKKQIAKRVILVAVAAIVPSVFLGADIVKKSVFDGNVNNFVEREFQFENTQVVKYNVDEENKELRVAVIGTTLDAAEIANLERSMKGYHIDNLMLKVQQTEVKAGITTDELEAYVKSETSQLTAENAADYQDLKGQLIAANSELSAYKEKEIEVETLQEEISVLYPSVTAMQAGYLNQGENEVLTVILEVEKPLSVKDMRRVNKWLAKRLAVEELILYQNAGGILYPADYRIPEEKADKEEQTTENASEAAEPAEGN